MDYTRLASDEQIQETVAGLAERNVQATVVASGADALATIKEWIPAGASVMNGSSQTLQEIGYIDYLKAGQHGWRNLHAEVLAEPDEAKQVLLRKQAVLSDYYLGSVHGLSKTGEFVIASNTGSQLPHIVFTSQYLIFVVGIQKIVPTLAAAIERLEQYVVGREDESMRKQYGMGTILSKMLIFRHENPSGGRNVRMILVREVLGF